MRQAVWAIQPGEGVPAGVEYLPAEPGAVLWGRLPCAADAPVLTADFDATLEGELPEGLVDAVEAYEAALAVTVNAPTRGGRGLVTQLWSRESGVWRVRADRGAADRRGSAGRPFRAQCPEGPPADPPPRSRSGRPRSAG